MDVNRQTIINGNKIQEYYWANHYVTYINNNITKETYEEAVNRINKEAEQSNRIKNN